MRHLSECLKPENGGVIRDVIWELRVLSSAHGTTKTGFYYVDSNRPTAKGLLNRLLMRMVKQVVKASETRNTRKWRGYTKKT